MDSTSSRYRCRACGSASYQRLTHRTASGAMGYSGLHRCSGCSVTFSNLKEWSDGVRDEQAGSEQRDPHGRRAGEAASEGGLAAM